MKNIFNAGLITLLWIYGCQSNQQKLKEDRSDNLSELSDTLVYSSPEEAGMSSTKVKEASYLFEEAVKENKVIGYQILVARNGKVVLYDAGGLRDYENKLPMDKNTLINMASNTKSITAIAILKLIDEGKISLDDHVSKYLSGFDSEPSNKITIKQLLLHRAGFTKFSTFLGEITPHSAEEPNAPSIIVEAKKIGMKGPEFEPDSMFWYNNMGYNILGAIIEKASQMKLDKYFKKYIYEPLGMNETSHFLWEVDTNRLAKQYYFNEGKWERMETLSLPFARASGGTISNAWDFAHLFQMLVNKGIYNNHRILNENTVIEATSPIENINAAYLTEEVEKSLGLESSEWYEYRDARSLNLDMHRGYGFVVANNGGFSHAGIYGTFAYADSKKDLVIIILTQSIYGGNPGQRFIETIYNSIIE